jgi:hypothetical protein
MCAKRQRQPVALRTGCLIQLSRHHAVTEMLSIQLCTTKEDSGAQTYSAELATAAESLGGVDVLLLGDRCSARCCMMVE